MNQDNKAWIKALKVLPYTILINAVFGAVMLICVTAVDFCVEHYGCGAFTGEYVLSNTSTFAQAMVFIGCIICIACLGSLGTLSDDFYEARKIMVSVIILDCLVIMLSLAGMVVDSTHNGRSIDEYRYILQTVIAVDKILKGYSFMQVMKAYSDVLHRDGSDELSQKSAKLGTAYMCAAVAGALTGALEAILKPGPAAGALLLLTVATMAAAVVIGFGMFNVTNKAGFQIWRKRKLS